MKRKISPQEAKRILSKAPLNVSFWLCTNETLRSLEQVLKALERANDEVFRYHINRDKNDFEAWIRDIIRDRELAREISRIKTRETLIRKISERVQELSFAIIKVKKAPARKHKQRPSKALRKKAGTAKRVKPRHRKRR